MSPAILLLLAFGLGLVGWLAGRSRAWAFRRTAPDGRIHSLPQFHAWYVGLWVAVPAVLFALLWDAISPVLVLQHVLADPAAAALPAFGFEREALMADARAVATGAAPAVFNSDAEGLVEPFRIALGRYDTIGLVVTLLIAFAGGAFSFLRLRPDFTARTRVERAVMAVLLIASLVAILTTVGIVASLVFETVRFFGMVSPSDFLLGTHWAPDPMSSGTPDGGAFGALPLFWGTIYIGAIIAMAVAIPLGLMSAIYLTQYASASVRSVVKPLLEILAGVPTVVYGYFAALTVAPAVRDAAQAIGIAAVPQAMRDGSLAMGATRAETIRKVLVPAALPGIVAGIMLAVSRAIGETMIVVMAAGATANLSANPFESMTTVTFQIVAMLTGEGSFDHPATLSAFALGMVLFLVTLALNFIALRVVKRYREAYE
jgi:phosphate transport system permease protein